MKATVLTVLCLMVTYPSINCEDLDESQSKCPLTSKLYQICPKYMTPMIQVECLFDYLYKQVNDTRERQDTDDQNFHSKLENINAQIDKMRQDMLTEKTSSNEKIEDISELLNNITTYIKEIDKVLFEVDELGFNHDKIKKNYEEVNSTLGDIKDNVSVVYDTVHDVIANVSTHMEEVAVLRNHFEESQYQSNDRFEEHEKKISEISVKMKSEFSEVRSSLDREVINLKGEINEQSKEINTYVDKVKADVDSGVKRVTNELSKLTSEFEEHKDNVDSEFLDVKNNLKSNVSEMNDKLNTMKKKLEDDVQSNTKAIETKLTGLKYDLAQHKQSVDNRFESFDQKLKAKLGEINEKITNLEVRMKAYFDTNIEKHETKLSELKADVESFKDQVQKDFKISEDKKESQLREVNKNLEDVIEDLKKEMRDMRDNLDSKINDKALELIQQTEEVNQTVTLHQGYVQTLYANALNKDLLIMIIGLLFAFSGINCLIIYLFVLRKIPSNTTNPAASYNGTLTLKESRSSTLVRRRVFSEPLKNSICILGFSEESQKLNKKLMKMILDDQLETYNDKIVTHVIRRHEDIPETPLTKICFMFVEFSERHVIIEEAGLGLGDLRKKTFHYLKEAGVCIVIVYVRDPDSRSIPDNTLYNKNIRCVTSQPELQELNEKKRFISIYHTFTTCQLDTLRKLITDNLQ